MILSQIAEQVMQLCRVVREAGGRALLVGGSVRDRLRGEPGADYDLEVYRLEPARLRSLLDAEGAVNAVGEAFTVYKVRLAGNLVVDVSLPRRESKTGRGHRGFVVTGDPQMSLEEAARRRDFTINAILYDPLADELIDPFHGRADIERKVIRAVDPATFVEDSLRVLRAMQFAARFEYEIDEATITLCRAIDLSDLPCERILGEVEKWLFSRKPSIGWWAARRLGIADKLWPECAALIDCPQEYEWHPEGWSLIELPFQPRVTSSAQSLRVDDSVGLALREFISGATTGAAMHPVRGGASGTEAGIDFMIKSFTPTPPAGANSPDSAPSSGPAVIAESESLVWSFSTPAVSADEVIRVVFQIPLDRMRPIVFRAVHDFEVVRRVVHPVAVYVMNMLMPFQATTRLQFHNDPVDRSSAIASGPTGVHITTIIVDARTASVDGYVLFDFDLAVIGNGNRAVHTGNFATPQRLFKVILGDVWIHTGMTLDEARRLIDDLSYPKQMTVMLAALCHDFGKPATTEFEDGRIRSKGHEDAGVAPTETFLARLNIHTLEGYDVRSQVKALVQYHLSPAHFYKAIERGETVSDGAFRRLAQKVEPDLLDRVARADCLGRTGAFSTAAMEWFIARARELAVTEKPPEPILKGRHVLALGLAPGPRVGRITRAVYELQLDGKVTTLEEAIAAAQEVIEKDEAE
jgi:hypothetical protein